MNIVVLDGATLNPGDNPWDEVARLGEIKVFDNTSPEQTVERSQAADIVVTNKVVIDGSVLSQLPKLKFIAVTATGYNVVDVAAAAQRGIPVSNIPVYSTDSVSQHVFAGLLCFLHRPEMHHQMIQAGKWQESGNFSFWKSPLFELAGKTMGIVGWGRIGQSTAKLAAAFKMRVVANSRTEKPVSGFPGFQWLSIEDLCAQADVISLHCPQTDSNTGLINRNLISSMKPNAILINTARGGLVNEADLAEALNEGQIAGAILDVVSAEPITSDNPLLSAQNCLLTPHMAWATIEARKRAMTTTAENISAFLSGCPVNTV